MLFLSSSKASCATVPSISGASSLCRLLLKSSTIAPEFMHTTEGTSFFTKTLKTEKPTATQGSQRADKLPFSHFVRLVRSAPSTIRTLPVIAIKTYQPSGKDTGLLPHRYSLVTVQHPTGGPPTYIKLHMRVTIRDESLASVLIAELTDDRAALAPSLDALAALLDIIDKRTGTYDLCGRNCMWLAHLVLFGCARKFRAEYLRGKMGVLAAAARCLLPEGWPGWLATACAELGPALGVFDMQHEVEDVVGKWRDFVGPAAVPAVVGAAGKTTLG